MRRRITIPGDHVALVLPAQLADELMALLRSIRSQTRRAHLEVERSNSTDEERAAGISDAQMLAHSQHNISGDVMLALLEARED